MRVLLLGLFLWAGLLHEPENRIAIIAHPETVVDSVDALTLRNIYILTFQRWDDGTKIAPFNYKADNELKDRLYRFIEKSPSDLRKIWLRYQLTGEGRPPKALKSEKAMLRQIGETEGAIGYVSVDMVDESVKIIAIIEP